MKDKRKQQPAIIVNSEAEAIEIVSSCGEKLRRLELRWQNNKKVVLAAIESSGFAFEHATKNMKDNAEVVYAAVRKEPRMLTEASKRWSDNEALREMAFKLNGHAFIVDKQAWLEFELLDKQLTNSRNKNTQNSTESDVSEHLHDAMEKSRFYVKFKRYYSGEQLTAEEIKELEAWLLEHRNKRRFKKEDIIDVNETDV